MVRSADVGGPNRLPGLAAQARKKRKTKESKEKNPVCKITVPVNCYPEFGPFMTENNKDFLSDFLHEDEEMKIVSFNAGDDTIEFPSSHMFSGFIAAKKILLDMNYNDEVTPDHAIWSYATTASFHAAYQRDVDQLGEYLHNCGVNLILLPPRSEWEVASLGVSSDILDYLASLVKHNIWVYPPLSIVHAITNKKQRVSMLESLKLPQAWVVMDGETRSWTKLVESAKEQNEACVQGTHCVVKSKHGCACIGVYVLVRDAFSQMWTEVGVALFPFQENDEVSVEPFSS